MRANGPAQRPDSPWCAPGNPAAERALRCLGLVDNGDQLEIGVAERHDPVGRAPAGVTALFLLRHDPRADRAKWRILQCDGAFSVVVQMPTETVFVKGISSSGDR